VPSRAEAPFWVQGLRSQLRSSVGSAWRVTEQRGKAKLDVRFADGSRRTAVLPMPWLPVQARSIQEAIEEIARRVAAGRPFPDAVAAVVGLPSVAPLPPAAGGDKEALLRQSLLEVCPGSPGRAAASTVPCAGTAPDHWLLSPPPRLSLQAI
jgi:hypothetical protein